MVDVGELSVLGLHGFVVADKVEDIKNSVPMFSDGRGGFFETSKETALFLLQLTPIVFLAKLVDFCSMFSPLDWFDYP